MAEADYGNLQSCVQRANERSGTSDSALTEEILRISAGHTLDTPDTPVYRPFWAAAELLDQKRGQLQSAEGASFRDVQKTIDALRKTQWTLDKRHKLVVPVGTSQETLSSVGSTLRRSTNGRMRVVNYGR